MIDRSEIEAKANEFAIHTSNVQRDYVFGWLLFGMYSGSPLGRALLLKGGNCFRKAYFPNTRFSRDLDFATQSAINQNSLREEFNRVCQLVQDQSGVLFDIDRNKVELQHGIDSQRSVYEVKLYFKDFYGNPEKFTISVSLDVTEFERIYLPPQKRFLIHPYSDSPACTAEIRCLKLEEMLAEKLKCLLQRREVSDLYDLGYSIFLNRDLAVDRSEVLSTFLRKTIFQPSPGVARQLLLELPFGLLKTAWQKYIVCPIQSALDFDSTVEQIHGFIAQLFAPYGAATYGQFAYFPSELRNPIMQAGAGLNLLRLTYDGVRRDVEPVLVSLQTSQGRHWPRVLLCLRPNRRTWKSRNQGSAEHEDSRFRNPSGNFYASISSRPFQSRRVSRYWLFRPPVRRWTQTNNEVRVGLHNPM